MTSNTEPVLDTEATSDTEAELDLQLTADELLADMPELRPPHRLRLRHRNRIMSVFFKAQRDGLLGSGDDDSENDELSPDKLEPMLELLADIDDFAESIAHDPDAYAEWAESKSGDYDVFLALMNRYVGAVGESNSSAS